MKILNSVLPNPSTSRGFGSGCECLFEDYLGIDSKSLKHLHCGFKMWVYTKITLELLKIYIANLYLRFGIQWIWGGLEICVFIKLTQNDYCHLSKIRP